MSQTPNDTRRPNFDIDLVYTWVDGADPEFQKSRSSYLCDKYRNQVDAHIQFDELKYSLRGIEMFAPWFRKIFIVTNSQIPQWLKTHAKIRVVHHSEIYRWPEHLPTFNSFSIECHLHRVPDLAEHFVYANDDTFIGAPVEPTDFFTLDGRIVLPVGSWFKVLLGAGVYHAALFNSWRLCKNTFGAERNYFISAHQMKPFTKTLFQTAESLWPDAIKTASSFRFRDKSSVELTTVLLGNLAYYSRLGTLGEKKRALYFDAGKHSEYEKLFKRRPKFFCMNGFSNLTDIVPLLEKYFPNASSFEQS